MTRPSRHAKRDALDYIYDKCIAGDAEALAELEVARTSAAIARQIYDLRTAAGLTQAQLAKRVGTTASVICQLEDADYQGRTLQLLQRVAAALKRTVDVRLIPKKARRS
jgi:DNA-binding XRE family transcriptional regulator